MRKLIIFLYFVFLFKLAFAQSLPSLPNFSEFSSAEPSAGTAELAQVPDMPDLNDDDDTLPGDLGLPASDKKAENNDQNKTDTSAQIDIEAPTLAPSLQETTLQQPELPNEFETPELPPTADTGSTPVVPQAEVNDIPKLPDQDTGQKAEIQGPSEDEAPVTETGATGPMPQTINSENSERAQFPETPDLNYEKNKKSLARDENEKAQAATMTPEDREKEVDNLLNQVFDKGKTPEQIAQEKAQEAADAEAAAKEKAIKQEDSPLMEKVVDVNEQPVKPIDELRTDDDEQFPLSDIPASMKDSNSSPFNEVKARAVYTSSTYSEQQLSSMLVSSAMRGNKDSVADLLHSGRSPNSQNTYGETALMGAVYNGHNDIAEMLLSEGADPNIPDNKGDTSMLVAAARNNLQAVQLIIKAGGDIDLANNGSDTPLLVATLNNNIDVVHTLVHQGADINKPNSDGLTALHIAAYNGNPVLVKYLLSVGANPNIVARGGHKPFDLAKDPNSAQLIASYVENQQKIAEAKKAAEEMRTQNNISATLQQQPYNNQYVSSGQPVQQTQVPQNEWWAAKTQANIPAAQPQQNLERADYSGFDNYQMPASMAYKNMAEQRGYVPVQPEQSPTAPVSTEKKWTKLTVDSQTPAIPQQSVNNDIQQLPVQQQPAPQNVYAPQAPIQQQPQEGLVRAVYDANGNIINAVQQPVVQQPVMQQNVVQIPTQAPYASYQNNVQAPVQQPPFTAPASMTNMVAAAVPTAVPVNYAPVQQPQQIQTVIPQQYILPQGPISNTININVPKYAELEPAKQAVWDMKLAQWVKDGMTINARSEGEKIYWMKQQKVLQAVYQEQFGAKVESVKRKMTGAAFRTPAVSKSFAGTTVNSGPVKYNSSVQGFKTSSAVPDQYLSVYTASN